MSLGQMIKKVMGAYLAIDFMLLFINLPFSSLAISNSENGYAVKLLPALLLGCFTVLIFFALMVGYMAPLGAKLTAPGEEPPDKLFALKAALIVFAPLLLFGAFTSLTGAGVILSPSVYEGMKFVYNVLYGPLFGFVLAFYNKTWLLPMLLPVLPVLLIELAYAIAISGVKLPKLLYRSK